MSRKSKTKRMSSDCIKHLRSCPKRLPKGVENERTAAQQRHTEQTKIFPGNLATGDFVMLGPMRGKHLATGDFVMLGPWEWSTRWWPPFGLGHASYRSAIWINVCSGKVGKKGPREAYRKNNRSYGAKNKLKTFYKTARVDGIFEVCTACCRVAWGCEY